MWLNPQKGLAKRYEIGNVENQIWCELVKLHTVDKKKSTKEFVGRERKSAQKKIKKITRKPLGGLGIRAVLGKVT
jgi:hypothetical protein